MSNHKMTEFMMHGLFFRNEHSYITRCTTQCAQVLFCWDNITLWTRYLFSLFFPKFETLCLWKLLLCRSEGFFTREGFYWLNLSFITSGYLNLKSLFVLFFRSLTYFAFNDPTGCCSFARRLWCSFPASAFTCSCGLLPAFGCWLRSFLAAFPSPAPIWSRFTACVFVVSISD